MKLESEILSPEERVIVSMLRSNKRVYSYMMTAFKPYGAGIQQYGRVIHSLRHKHEFTIENKRDEKGHKYFTLIYDPFRDQGMNVVKMQGNFVLQPDEGQQVLI